MGATACAHLAYGWNLGSEDDLATPPWVDTAELIDAWEDDVVATMEARIASVPGVVIYSHGHHDYPSHALVMSTVYPHRLRTLEWGQAFQVGPTDLAFALHQNPGIDGRLRAAADLLQITPGPPSWLLLASYR